MEQTFDKEGYGPRGLTWLGMVLGSLMVCPKLLTHLPSWERDEEEGESRPQQVKQ